MQNTVAPPNSKKITGFLALLVVSFIFQLAGCVTPGWIYLEFNSMSIHFGLWYALVCVGDTCDTVSHGDLLTSYPRWAPVLRNTMREFQIETCIAIAACITAIALLQHTKRRFNGLNNRSLLTAAFISCALSGILALVASGKFADKVLTEHNLLNDFNIPSPYRFAYSLFLTGLGGILASIAPFLALCFYRDCGQSQQSHQSQPLQQRHMTNQQPAYFPQAGNAYYSQAGNVTSVEHAYPMATITTNNQSSFDPPVYPAQPPPYHVDYMK